MHDSAAAKPDSTLEMDDLRYEEGGAHFSKNMKIFKSGIQGLCDYVFLHLQGLDGIKQ